MFSNLDHDYLRILLHYAIQVEIDDQNLVQQVNEEPIQINTDVCVLCNNPRNGTTNWGFLHNGEVHHNYCETCKDNLDEKPGDLCPLHSCWP